jgi:phosphoglycolate phosphatase-like HAD superfamily hydrolase
MRQNKNNIKVIFWDFDGVIIDSNNIREMGFKRVLSGYPIEQVEQLLNYHRINGGLSRYVKFDYFFREIRNERTHEKEILELAFRFSNIMKQLLVNEDLIIREIIDFISKNHNNYIMHITSGSDEEELRFLCKEHGIDSYFSSINGSPTPKMDLIEKLMLVNGYDNDECVVVGDSRNDLEASTQNNILFLCYNNDDLCIDNHRFVDFFK